MPDVRFEEENQWEVRRFDNQNDQSSLVKLIMKTGLVKDPKNANYVLLGVAGIFVLVTIIVVLSVLN